MKSISRIFIEECTTRYVPLGFSRSKTVFVRIIGDVIQAFSLKIYQTGYLCTVEFGVFPMCQPGPVFLEAGGYELGSFRTRDTDWMFDPRSIESIENCIESIVHEIDLHLLPLFETCIDCKSTLSELIRLEELFDRNRQESLCLLGDSDCAIPWQERSLFDDRKYYMALKARDFAYAHRYLTHQVAHYTEELKSLDLPNSPKQPRIVKERFAARLALQTERLERINSGDVAYFEEQLHFNEAQMTKFLTTKYSNLGDKGTDAMSHPKKTWNGYLS